MDNVLQLVDALGLPVTILAVMALALYRLAKWLAPKFEVLFQAHIELVTDLQDQSRMQTDMSRKTLSLVSETHAMIKNLPDTLSPHPHN